MAFGTGTIASAGGAVDSLFSGFAHETKAKGLRIEAGNYERSAAFAEQSAQFIQSSTEIKQAQMDRSIFQTLGGQEADVAGAGFASSGSALDILRDSASQGALMKAVSEQQGLINEEGYHVQAKNFEDMAAAAKMAADAEDTAAIGSYISGGFKAVNAVASIFVK